MQPRVKNIAEIRQLLGERFDEIGRRMTALERGIPASGVGGSAAGGTAILGDQLGALRGAGPSQAGGTPGVLGVTAGLIDSAATLRDARAMLGRGTRESGAGEGTLGALVGLVGDPPPGLPAPRRPPAARAPRPGQQPQHGQHPPAATASSGEGALLGRLVDLLESRSGRGESRAELFGLGLVLSGVRTTTRQQLGRSSEAVSMPGSQAPVESSGWRGSSLPVVLIRRSWWLPTTG